MTLRAATWRPLTRVRWRRIACGVIACSCVVGCSTAAADRAEQSDRAATTNVSPTGAAPDSTAPPSTAGASTASTSTASTSIDSTSIVSAGGVPSSTSSAVVTTAAPTTSPPAVTIYPPLGEHSATLDQLPDEAATTIAPVGLTVADVGIDAPIVPVSADPTNGELIVPNSHEVIGWYQFGSTPGAPGTAALAAHVDWKGDLGAFFELRHVQPGALVTVTMADGRALAYTVTSVEQIAKVDLPQDRVFARDGPSQLALITCGGHFDRSTHHYDDNIIVFRRAGHMKLTSVRCPMSWQVR